MSQPISCTQRTVFVNNVNSTNKKILLFLISIIIGVELFIACLGGIGLFGHSSSAWITNITDVIRNVCNNYALWAMMIGGSLLAIGEIGIGIYLLYSTHKRGREFSNSTAADKLHSFSNPETIDVVLPPTATSLNGFKGEFSPNKGPAPLSKEQIKEFLPNKHYICIPLGDGNKNTNAKEKFKFNYYSKDENGTFSEKENINYTAGLDYLLVLTDYNYESISEESIRQIINKN